VKISAPGWHDGISSDDYHSGTICDGPSISASGLKKIALDCPAIYWAESALNPKRELKETKALDFGKAAHCLMLGEPTFAAEFIISPYDDFRGKEARAWRDEQTKTIVSATDLDIIKAMAAELKATPYAARAFTNGTPERSYFTKDKETGIWLKARPDWLPSDPSKRFVVEYKTAASVKPDKFGYQAFDLGYDLQAALMLDVIEAVHGYRPLGIAHVVQMKAAPYLCSVQYFTPDQLLRGRRMYRAALRTFADCWAAHTRGDPERLAWPGYQVEPQPIVTPYRIAKEIAEEAERSYNEPSRNHAA
jgi:hypothetical protein